MARRVTPTKGGGAMDEFVSVANVSNEVEASAIASLLEGQGIPVVIRTFTIGPFDPQSAGGGGALGIGPILAGRWGEVFVPRERADEARGMIRALREEAEGA